MNVASQPTKTFTCNYNGCEEEGTCSTPIHHLGELENNTFCDSHGDTLEEKGVEVYDVEWTLMHVRPAPMEEVHPSPIKKIGKVVLKCGHEGCKATATRNRHVHLQMKGVFHYIKRRALCGRHAKGKETFSLDITLTLATQARKGGWVELINEEPPANMSVNFYCRASGCGKIASLNYGVNPNIVTIERLSELALCDFHADLDDNANLFPIKLTIRRALDAHGGWEDWKHFGQVEQPRRPRTPRFINRSPAKTWFTTDPYPFGDPPDEVDKAKMATARKRAQQARKRARSAAAKAAQATPKGKKKK